ncbi:hypothetical protein EMIHUDRAFT_223134 [Emiliania huxleyi CCMP1516]|uniref:Protein MON2 homolog n=2 Tax=Emiliania huxleyi TaxID=2903 RepID=A0A0D3KW06_EMIH1|nr:hypothetical protein EMIHUDRAFT_223134 [Emiliania huxleyi CCMP1516]EOD39941.1 hypothetical protein EMIHUDRAFT_223134 [Emiliania huxleyi CCMP1516]|eukprot:XP_005792370.1 hypothetical protein EMIHUDRAFT_223134 [Emiliania huxleyi CCMP1516]
MALLRTVETDLRSLSMEARRRFPEVKEAAERALQRLRTAQESLRQDAPLAEQAAAVATSEEVLLPFTLALACKSEALPLCALSAVQRMISHSAVAPVHLPAIASQLIARAQMPSEDSMLLKVLQTWLTGLSSPVPTVFALEVVQRTLASHATLFLGQPDFRHLLHEHVCPLALKCMQHTVQHQAVTDWEHALRACHLTATLLLSYARAVRTEAEILLVTLGKMLEAEGTPIWQRALVLETFRLLSSDAPLLTAIFTAYDLSPSSSNALATLVGATTKLLTSPQVDFLAHAEFIEPLFLRLSRSASNSKAATFNTALYSEADGSHVTNDYAAALAIECRAAAHGTASGEEAAKGGGVERAKIVIGGVHLSMSEAARGEMQLARFSSDEAVQATLKAFQAFTHACGRLSMQQPRDALLAALCRYALPPRARQELQEASALSFAPPDAAYEPLPHTSLSAKNVLALKALFNIAHCMGSLLGSSWNLVLQTFEQLDRIILSSKLTAASPQSAERAAALGGADAATQELGLLHTALSNLRSRLNLFASVTVELDDEALGHFLTALSTQCFASLAHEATSKEKLAAPGSGAGGTAQRLFALTRFVETVLCNLHRAPALWPLVTQLLLPVANHKVPRIRVVGIESLEAEYGGWGGGWDRHVLSPLEELQRRCAHRETQERVLQCVHQLLRSCGAGLVEGWLLILSILWRAATKPALLPLLPLAIRSVQLIASDFLPSLPPPCLLAYVEAELAGSALAPAPRYGELRVEEPVESHELWCAIARQLRRLAADERTEVRTCSLHTLTSILTSHGAQLSGSTWDYALFRALLPMMREVCEAAAAACATQQVAKPLGKEGGVPVLMLLHHSRDTASKQWDETWVLLLHSSTRLFRAFLPTLMARPRFSKAWARLLAFCRTSLLAARRSVEVSKAAIHALAPATPHERLPIALWTSVWGLIESASSEMAADAEAYDANAEAPRATTDHSPRARDRFEEADVLRLARLAVPPGASSGWDPYRPPAKPSPLQLSALKLHAYSLLLQLLTSGVPPLAQLEVLEDALQVLRAILELAHSPEVLCPALPKEVARTFVGLTRAVLPALALASAGETPTAGSDVATPAAHDEMIRAMWALLSPPPQRGGGAEAEAEYAARAGGGKRTLLLPTAPEKEGAGAA